MTSATETTHWQQVRLAWVLKPAVNAMGDSTVLSVYRDHGIVPKASRDDNFNRTPLDLTRYQKVDPNDVVVNRMKAWQGSLGVSGYAGIVSPDYEVLKISRRGVLPRFMHYLLRSRPLIDQYAIRSTGIRPSQWRLYWEQMRLIEVLLPPLKGQRAIAEFLDRETAQIDSLIAKQEQLIETLRERRLAIIRHAIPRASVGGIDSDKLGRWTAIGNGSTPRRDNPAYWLEGTFPWLNSSVVNMSRVIDSDQLVTATALRECHLPIVRPLSILIGLTGQGKTRGMATILDVEATINQHLAYITPDLSRWIPEYVLWSLIAAYSELRQISDENGSTKGGLTCEDVKRFRIVRPELAEQQAISVRLTALTSQIDGLIAKAREFIETVKERRSALITAAVTGQIDVRKSA